MESCECAWQAYLCHVFLLSPRPVHSGLAIEEFDRYMFLVSNDKTLQTKPSYPLKPSAILAMSTKTDSPPSQPRQSSTLLTLLSLAQTLLLAAILGVGIYLAIRMKHLEYRLFTDEDSFVETHAHFGGSSPFEISAARPIEIVGISSSPLRVTSYENCVSGQARPCVNF
ncbi:MAG: hypothetical protein Q9160_006243 [Pyrenula sp. 1 TL-2023]